MTRASGTGSLPNATLSRTLRSSSVGSWSTSATRRRSTAVSSVRRSSPPSVTAPRIGSKKRSARRAIVLLPPPEGPTMAMMRPGAVSNETSSSTSRGAIGNPVPAATRGRGERGATRPRSPAAAAAPASCRGGNSDAPYANDTPSKRSIAAVEDAAAVRARRGAGSAAPSSAATASADTERGLRREGLRLTDKVATAGAATVAAAAGLAARRRRRKLSSAAPSLSSSCGATRGVGGGRDDNAHESGTAPVPPSAEAIAAARAEGRRSTGTRIAGVRARNASNRRERSAAGGPVAWAGEGGVNSMTSANACIRMSVLTCRNPTYAASSALKSCVTMPITDCSAVKRPRVRPPDKMRRPPNCTCG